MIKIENVLILIFLTGRRFAGFKKFKKLKVKLYQLFIYQRSFIKLNIIII